MMAPQLRINAVAFVSPQNHPILIKTFSQSRQDELKYHYIAHTSLDVIDERSELLHLSTDSSDRNNVFMRLVQAATASKSTDCYLGLLYVEDVAVYGYMTPLKVKIIIALELSDSLVRDADVVTVRCLIVVVHARYALRSAQQLTFFSILQPKTTDLQGPSHRLQKISWKSILALECAHREYLRPRDTRILGKSEMESIQGTCRRDCAAGQWFYCNVMNHLLPLLCTLPLNASNC